MKKNMLAQESINILIALLSVDFLFVFLDIMHRLEIVKNLLPVFEERVFSISTDRGLAESYQYVKEYWLVLLMLWLVLHCRKTSYLPWAVLYAYFLFDDMLGIHEVVGEMLVRALGYAPEMRLFLGLRAQDCGELSVAGMVGIFVGSVIILFYIYATDEVKKVYRNLFLLLLGFASFGIGVDALPHMFDARIVQKLLKLLEDGGEMAMMSVTLWYVYTVCEKQKSKAALETVC
jgi:hypothetical protein